MSELKILGAALKQKKVITAIQTCMNPKEEFTSQAQLVYKRICKWYDDDPNSNSVDSEILKASLMRENKRHADKLGQFVDHITDLDVSEVNVLQEIVSTKTNKIMQELGARMLNFEPYESMVDELGALEELHSSDFVGRDLSTHEYEVWDSGDFEELLVSAVTEERIPIFPTNLNNHLGGGVWRKASIVVFGRPDVGKTTFMVNLSCGFLNTGLKVMYLANEDPATQLLIRHVQCFSKMQKDEVEKNLSEKVAECKELGLQNLILIETPAGTMSHLEALIKDHRPDVIIIDQLRNMRSAVENRVLQLEDTQRNIRELGKKYNSITVSVTQAGASADQKNVLDMTDIDYSKTGIAGGCDLIIGIGANNVMLQQGLRFLSFPKNKINGNKEPLETQFRTDIVRVH